jgi:hypothetical protein
MNGSRPVSLFKGRYKYIYGVDGNGRGFRWDPAGITAQPIGLVAPAASVSVNSITASTNAVVGVDINVKGDGYFKPPDVLFRGGGLSAGDPNHARGQAVLRNGGVDNVIVTYGGAGYSNTPSVEFTGGKGSGASFTVGVNGGIASCRMVALGSGYTNGASVNFYGVTGAIGLPVIEGGKITSIRIINAGTGAITGATMSISAVSGGAGASAECVMAFGVTSLTITSAGTNYAGRVNVAFTSLRGSGASAYCTGNRTGNLTSPIITSRGAYEDIPVATVATTDASGTALVRDPMKGSYRCCIRYVDSTPEDEGGPIPSVITEPITVDSTGGAQTFTWNWSNSGADARADYVELWRTSSNQAIVLYRVAKLGKTAGVLPTTYTDTLTEEQLLSPTRTDYGLMPITLPSGQLNARRFVVPPSNMEDACWFQDRAWFAGSTDGSQPNSLMFSEIDEPESVADSNEIVIQENTGNQDRIIGLFPYGSLLMIAQESRLYRMQYVSQPIIDAGVVLVGYRGLLSKRCWDSMDGVVFAVDSFGMYAYDGNSLEPVSAAVDNYWRDSIIDFSNSRTFFVQADQSQKVVRFYYCKSTDSTYPPRALCYSTATKCWWEETYAEPAGAATVVPLSGKRSIVVGTASGAIRKTSSGLTDNGSAIPYEFRTGPLPLVNEPDRRVGVLYTPTSTTSNLVIKAHFNGSTTYRPDAIQSDRGEGVVSAPDGTVINMSVSRSQLSDATGYATVRHAGRASDWSSGGDRHIAIDLSGSQSAAPVKIHGVTIGAVTS